ncbi:hypothetical protein OROMI_014202 [Orobanche minor]
MWKSCTLQMKLCLVKFMDSDRPTNTEGSYVLIYKERHFYCNIKYGIDLVQGNRDDNLKSLKYVKGRQLLFHAELPTLLNSRSTKELLELLHVMPHLECLYLNMSELRDYNYDREKPLPLCIGSRLKEVRLTKFCGKVVKLI